MFFDIVIDIDTTQSLIYLTNIGMDYDILGI